jgi:site-specific DNA recombinase
MNAAIYARRSKEQNDRPEEQKSITRQTELARVYAQSRGWTVVAEYSDDGISGAEFERRPGLQRLLKALHPRPAFNVLVVAEQKALGREAVETQMVIKQLGQAGVEVWGYMEKCSLTPRNWLDKAMSTLRAAADEAHREQTAMRTTEAHRQLAEKGRVTGGRVYGYRNVDVHVGVDVHGRPLRSHVERHIIPAEEAVVLRIFENFASGLGLKAIAKGLTLDRISPPASPARHDGLTPPGWAPSTVRSILGRELYRGVVVWGRLKKRDSGGKVHRRRTPHPVENHVRVEREELRIIPEDLWKRVASRRADTEGRTLRFESGRISGRPPKHATKNLLAGLAACGVCGGGLVVETSGHKAGRVPQYMCNRYLRQGSCTNGLRIDVELMNEAVLRAIEEHALTPEAVGAVVALSERDDMREQQRTLELEQKDVDQRISRLVTAIENGADIEPITAKLRELKARKDAIAASLANLRPVPPLPASVVEGRLAEWRRLLRQSITQGRAVLQRLLHPRITFTPNDGGGYDFTCPTRFDKLFAGVAAPVPAWMVPFAGEGLEGMRPDDTLEADYGALLERVYANPSADHCKGLASPAGVEPASPP